MIFMPRDVAGTDTVSFSSTLFYWTQFPAHSKTAGTLTAFALAMLLFPDTQRKAQAEIDQVIGFDRLPEMSDLPHLPYLNNLVQELFRWQPVLPLGTSLGLGVSSAQYLIRHYDLS
jgi:hypothetical protein